MSRRIHPPLAVDEALLNHLTLPPRLPQRQDRDLDGITRALVEQLVTAAQLMRDLPSNDHQSLWDSASRSLTASRSLCAPTGRLERSSLLAELRHVANADFLFLHIQSQNAVVFIQRSPE